MEITNAMIHAGLKKAVEAGLLARSACQEKTSADEELIRAVLEAALQAETGKKSIPAATRAHGTAHGPHVTGSSSS